jgi:GTP cyclohydrolase IA
MITEKNRRMKIYRADGIDDESTAADPKLTAIYTRMLEQLGEDPTREGLVKTPQRAAEALQFLTRGYHQNIDEVINEAIFTEDYDEMVIVKDIEFYSLCEHHILPFFGRCHVGYIPRGKIIGLSKIPRLVDMFSRRLQVQERLTREVALALEDALDPIGVAVVIEAQHMCMMVRGVQKQHPRMMTNVMLGAYRDEDSTRAEFMRCIQVS